MENSKKLSFNMRYAGIKTSKFNQHDVNLSPDSLKNPLIEFQTNIQFRVFEKEQHIGCLVNVKMFILETNEEFAELQVENLFDIKPFEDVVLRKGKDKFEVSDTVMVNLASISVSTVRGILYEKLKGTIAQNEVYPLIDVSNFNKSPAKSN